MALLKKLFNKDSQEVKEYWKAFGNLYKKVNQKNLDAFLQAQKACPDIWQGPFLLSIIYEIQNAIPSDPQKARMYREQALKTAQGTEDQEWVETFYGYFDIPAINWKKAKLSYMTEEVHAIRRLGVAALTIYEAGQLVVVAHDENDDAEFWCRLFQTCTYETDEASPFVSAFNAWRTYKCGRGKADDIKYYSKDLISECNKSLKKFNKNHDREERGKTVDEVDYKYGCNDMYRYICGYYRIVEGPYDFTGDDHVRECGGEMNSGVDCMRNAANMGSAPAVHYLAELANADDDEVRTFVRRALNTGSMSVDSWLKGALVVCAKAGDSEALRLLDEYYPEK